MAEIQTYLYGRKFPNRIFVGGLPLNTNAYELANFFNFFGNVTESKIILDDSGLSKGYGFVTFESKSTVKKVEASGMIFFKNKKINIGPAVRKEASVCQSEIVMWPVTSAGATTTTVIAQQHGQSPPLYNTLGYTQPQPPAEPFVAVDHYGNYQMSNDGVHWYYPSYHPVIVNQNIPQMPYPAAMPVPDFGNHACSPNGSSVSSSDDELQKVVNRYSRKKKDLPPRFLRK